jgi:predicted lipid-binding transport protein (Tim44 family)
MTSRGLAVLVTLIALAGAAEEAWARARGGGSRGSRSYSAPARPVPGSPAAPARPSASPMPAPSTRPSPLGGLAGALGGFVLGGLLGSLLFGGLGGMGSGLGLGLLDVLLIGGGLVLLVRLMQSRRREPAYAGAAACAAGGGTSWDAPAVGAVLEPPPGLDELERGLRHVRQMDPGFDAAALAAEAAEAFRVVQAALSAGELEPLRGRLSPEMWTHLSAQSEELGRAGCTNRIERIQVEHAEVAEAWQERGRDFVTVMLAGSLIDYTVDAGGAVVAGSRTRPERFEESWTFTRPVGPNPWALTAIETA